MKLTKLQAAVLEQLDGESYSAGDYYPDRDSEVYSTLQDVVNHGADGGFFGFTYYVDTCQFTLDNWADIIAMARELAGDIGAGSVAELVAGFNCLKGVTVADVEDVLMDRNGEGEWHDQVLNALAWFALEETARAIGESYSAGDYYPDRDSEVYSTLQDVVNHGADGGFFGFTYYVDTCQFTLDNWADIIALARELAVDIGVGSVAELVAGFNCLKGVTVADVEDVLMDRNGSGDWHEQVLNALAWFALEETARAIVEGVGNDD